MAIKIQNTNYNGEVLERLLTLATTGNEIVEKGLIYIIPGVEKKISVPRLKTGKMLQQRKELPKPDDSQGDFKWSEKELNPKDCMAFTLFNPRTFEHVWRRWQPKGELVFADLPPEGQNALLDVMSRQIQMELGDHYINGEHGTDDDHLFDGILIQIKRDKDVLILNVVTSTMTDRLRAIRDAIPVAIRNHPNLRILMSIADFDAYDDELTQRESKNADETKVNEHRFKGITIETLAAWPQGLIIATLCADDISGNLFAAVNLQDDEHVIQIDKYMNAGELYFFKMLLKVDTNIGFGEEVVVLDFRDGPEFIHEDEAISVDPSEISFASEGETKEVEVTATGDYSFTGVPRWANVEYSENGLAVTVGKLKEGDQRSATMQVTLDADKTKTATIQLTQTPAE
ncbi:hypothetical protein EZS27_004691 [termite gut metagenome]|uniref:BACON domain-containing protein n=1 Tax=termite gut metagenome TaxID=433724 RepID=A0A5J4SP55_9ZZZZ